MGNPKRYIMNGDWVVWRPEINQELKQFIVVVYSMYRPASIKDSYEEVVIDLYMAPDMIIPYSNGNTTKDEWLRYEKHLFKNVKLINTDKFEKDKMILDRHTFSYETYERNWCEGEEMTANIPLGKFQGMSAKDVANYKRKNRFPFKDWKPEPSKEAIEAALNAQPTSVWPLGEDDVKEMLTAAYKIDL